VKALFGTWSKSRLTFLAIGIVFVAFGVVSLMQH
jgi:hypothetical protein